MNVPIIKANNIRKAMALMVKKFYQENNIYTVAVTGTNGKTSSVDFYKQLCKKREKSVATIGTLGVISDIISQEFTTATLDAGLFYPTMKEFENAGITHVAMEATSQGLDQCRLEGAKVNVAAFTNLTQDHLDYHGDMEEYFIAKSRLFSEVVSQDGVAIINVDVEYGDRFLEIAKKRGLKVLTYGRTGSDIKLLEHTILSHGQKIKIEVLGEVYEVELSLIGDFQAYNALCALSMVISEFLDDKEKIAQTVKELENLRSVRGRLELSAVLKNKAAIYVDYAHTPDAVISVLKAIRPHVPEASKLHAIVGCGGDRDRTKRPIMGKAAVELADVAIVTDDNPRTEDPAFVRSEVMAGAVGAKEIAPRDNAIKQAVAGLGNGDILVIVGKGHEDYQVIGTTKTHFDDVEEVQKAVEELENKVVNG